MKLTVIIACEQSYSLSFILNSQGWATLASRVVTVDPSDNVCHVLVLKYCSPRNYGSNDVPHGRIYQMDQFGPLLDTFLVIFVNMDDASPKRATASGTTLKGQSFGVPHAVV